MCNRHSGYARFVSGLVASIPWRRRWLLSGIVGVFLVLNQLLVPKGDGESVVE